MTKTFRNPTVEEVEKGEKLLSCIKGSKKMAKAMEWNYLKYC
jgi:hypothetical protein